MIEVYDYDKIITHFVNSPTSPLTVSCPGSGSWTETFYSKEHYQERMDAWNGGIDTWIEYKDKYSGKKKNIFDGTTHSMDAQICFIKEENGKMFCQTMCSNRCCDKEWEINEGDIVITRSVCLVGNLKGLKVIASEFSFRRAATIKDCELIARDYEKYPIEF